MCFRFLNIPVRIHPTFWIFVLFFTNIYRDPSIESLILGIVLTFSLLVHEYGHALTALFFGARPTVTLEAFGGNAQYDSFGITPKQEFIITLNGPLLESMLIAISYFLLKSGVFEGHQYIQYFLYVMMRLNILWCLLNLIPITPLDGGHLLKYLLERKFGPKGTKMSLVVGLVAAAISVPYLYIHGFFFFGTLLLIFGLQQLPMFLQARGPSKGNRPFDHYMKGIEANKNEEVDKK